MSLKSIAGKVGSTVGSFIAGGVGWQAYAWAALAGAAAVGGALWWHADKVDDHYEASFKAGRLEVENEQLRETQRELTRMVGVVDKLNEVYLAQLQAVSDAESAAAVADERVRKLAAQRKQALATAPAEAVRAYAATAGDVYAACRTEYRALGFDAERCSAAAHTLDDYATQVSREKLDSFRATLRTKPE
jgi:Asp-tRNA(Asn)/Glu-tRNA(Gln) amidotransferase C subunit